MKRIKLNPTQALYQRQHANRYRKHRDESVECLPCDVQLVTARGVIVRRGTPFHILLTALRALQVVDGDRAAGSLRKTITAIDELQREGVT